MAADTRCAAAPVVPADLAASPQTPPTAAEPRALLQQLACWMQASGYGPDHPWCMAVAASLAAHPAVPAAAPRCWPHLVGAAPLFNIATTTYAIPAGASLPGLVADLHYLLTSCEGILKTIAEELISPMAGQPSDGAKASYWGALLLLQQGLGIAELAAAMTEFPDNPASWGVVPAGQPSEGGAA